MPLSSADTVGTAPQSSPHPAPRARRPALALATVLLAAFVVPTAVAGTALAVPAIGADLDAAVAPLQWVLNGFNVTFACFTLVWGSAADRIGRTRAFVLGAALYAGASVLSAVAPTIVVLDVARALAGIGGAAVFTCGSAILAALYSGPARMRAFALFGTVSGVGIAFGPLLSGALLATLGWRWIFAVHAGALLVVLAAVPLVMPVEPAAQRRRAPGDPVGSILFIVAMLLLTCGIVQASVWGWTGAGTVALLGASALAFVTFAVLEARHPSPVLDVRMLRNPRYLAFCLVPVVASFGFITLLTFLPTHLAAVGGYSSGQTGLILLLLTAPMLVLPLAAAALMSRGVRASTIVIISLLLIVAGDAGLALLEPGASLTVLALPLIAVGTGMAFCAGVVDGQALAMVPADQAGMAAGFLNTLRLGSEAVAVAVFGSVVATVLADSVASRLGSVVDVDAAVAGNLDEAGASAPASGQPGVLAELRLLYDSAFDQALWLSAGAGLLMAVVIVTLFRSRRPAR
ncbi:MFS transporter [Actinoplanes sp. NPDC023936]|uniref:MFS transporter n=1 Tax=Actinoplanes sp. NPDC023936 TaxID=3154910 RepID=UPI0033C599A3